MIKPVCSWEWQGPNGTRKTSITKERAESLVRCRGGVAIHHPEWEPTVEESAPVRPVAVTMEIVGDCSQSYGRGRYNGD